MLLYTYKKCIPTRKNIRVCMDKCIQHVRGSDAMASAVLLQWSLPLHRMLQEIVCVYVCILALDCVTIAVCAVSSKQGMKPYA